MDAVVPCWVTRVLAYPEAGDPWSTFLAELDSGLSGQPALLSFRAPQTLLQSNESCPLLQTAAGCRNAGVCSAAGSVLLVPGCSLRCAGTERLLDPHPCVQALWGDVHAAGTSLALVALGK